MGLQFIRRIHFHIPFLSYQKIHSKVRFMYATLNVAASHGAKYNQTFPVGQHNHHTTLRVESNQSKRRPTSWSFFVKTPQLRSLCEALVVRFNFLLLLRLKPRFRFPRNLERRWSLSSLPLSFSNPSFCFSVPSPSPIPLFGRRWVKGLSSILPHVHFSMALKISPYPLIPLPLISFQ